MNKSKKATIIIGILLILVGSLSLSPKYRAFVIMSLVSWDEKTHDDQNLALKIPTRGSGLDWFPLMIEYTDKGGYSQSTGQDARLTIYYTFGDYQSDIGRSCSTIFDFKSEYYSSFYGGYILKGTGSDFSDQPEMISTVPAYDYQNLILRDLGCEQNRIQFSYEIIQDRENVNYMGYEGWHVYDLKIQTLGLYHQAQKNLRHYVQFGSPIELNTEIALSGFEPIELYGRVYARYFEAEDSEVMMYVLTRDLELLNETDNQYLSQSEIILKTHQNTK